jgi:RNA ligase (TIGR02306 family)
MSEFHVNVYKLGPFTQHPNAETLDITKVFDYTVIAKQGNFKEGDLVVYVPIDSVVPDNEEWHWLAPRNQDGSERFPIGQVPEKYRLIEAKKIRGIFSQGCLSFLPPGDWKEGDDVREAMGITKYEPPLPLSTGGECEAAPKGWVFPTYTDIEGMRRYPHILKEGEPVVLTEKIHGANGRYVHDGERLWVGSHTQIKKRDDGNMWWQVAVAENLEEKLAKAPFHVFFGEVYGQVQDLKYGVKSGCRFRVFDVYDVKAQKYMDFSAAFGMAKFVGLEWVPTLYVGAWKAELNELCEGKSTLADNVREGFVARPMVERWNEEVGRVVLKRHGEGYLLRKKK